MCFFAGKTLQNPAELLKKAEQGGGMGSGQNHMIGVHQWKDQDAAFRSKYGSNSDHVGTQPRYSREFKDSVGRYLLILSKARPS